MLLRVGDEDIELQNSPWTLNGGATIVDAAPPWSKLNTLAHFEVTSPAPMPDVLPFEWSNEPPSEAPDYRDYVYTFSGSPYTNRWVINGETYPEITINTVPLGGRPIIEIRNLSPAEHPFHIHGLEFEVLEIDGVPSPYKRIEDTINVGIRQIIRIQLFDDNAGEWMLHCHLLPHAADGMMSILSVE